VALELPDSLPLRALKLSGRVTVEDLVGLAKFASLSELTLIDVNDLSDLRPFAALPGLRKLRLNDCRDLHSCVGIENLRSLEELDLAGSAIRFPEIPSSMSNLRKVNLDRCLNLGDIEELFALPGLDELILPPIDSAVLSELERRAASRSLQVICTPIFGGYETG
jgi:Leucine-rich repeat (LRR) protein